MTIYEATIIIIQIEFKWITTEIVIANLLHLLLLFYSIKNDLDDDTIGNRETLLSVNLESCDISCSQIIPM